MIIAAIDNSGSTEEYLDLYRNEVFKVLSQFKESFRIILWSSIVEEDFTCDRITNRKQIFRNRIPMRSTRPNVFLNVLPKKEPIDLYVFTDGRIYSYDVDECIDTIRQKNLDIACVHLYYVGIEKKMNLAFTNVFQGIQQEIYIHGKRVGEIKREPLDFNHVDFEYIMKDDSFKATVLSLINNPNVDKTQLKMQVSSVSNRILKTYFEVNHKLSIRPFYESRDVPGCVAYVKKHSYYNEKSNFQRKMAGIFKLFEKDIDTYSLDVFRDVLDSEIVVSENHNKEEEEEEEDDDNEELDSQCLTCDVLYDKCDIACIPVKAVVDAGDHFWPDKKTIRNPFLILGESEKWILRQVEPFVLDFNKTYMNLPNRDISPFSRDALKGVYLLHHPSLDAKSVIRHNNYVLSTLFCNKLPGKPVLWHMVFLYLLATRKFPEHREAFFRDIRRLGESETYFVTLSPHLNPPIVDPLNVCFWYMARVCPAAWPNNRKNVLRRPDFISGAEGFLDFYRDVYDPTYERPREMRLWRLWHDLCREGKTLIFRILSRYFRHDRLSSESDFGIILYRDRLLEDPSSMDLETVMRVYRKYLKSSNNFYENLSDLPPANLEEWLSEDKEGDDKLDHVRINIVTCHPYVKCPRSGKYWRNCAGNYDRIKESYLRLFRRYCKKYQCYPIDSEDLMVYLNEFIFEHTKIPELFHSSLFRQMDRVMDIFREVRLHYPCEEYLKISKERYKEEDRLLFEDAD